MVRVLVVADQRPVRESLCAAMAATPGIEVAGDVGDGASAVEQAAALRPDVVVLDLDLPEESSLEAIREIVLRRPGIAVLVRTVLERDDPVFAAMRAGARGYLDKGAAATEIARAVEAVAQGEIIFGPSIATQVLAWFASGGERPLAPLPELTDREREILDLVARGLTNAAIARRLFLPETTLRHHVANVFMKLQVADRSAVVARARGALGPGAD
jgi:DNA-binding NarL/FixJ family response regulator